MRLLIVLALLLTVAVRAQVRMICKPESMAAQKAGAIAATEVGRWNCSAKNDGATDVLITPADLELAFPELQTIAAPRASEILTQKAATSKPALILKVLGYCAVGAGFVAGLKGVDSNVVSILTASGSAFTLASAQVQKEVPSAASLIGSLVTSEFTLHPGGWKSWVVFASKMKNAQPMTATIGATK